MNPFSRRSCDFHSLLNCVSYEYAITHGILINGYSNAAVHTCDWHCPVFIGEHFWRIQTSRSLYNCANGLLVCKGDSNESRCVVFDVLTVLLWVTRTYTARNTLTRNRWFKSADGKVAATSEKRTTDLRPILSVHSWFVFSCTCLCVAKCILCVSAEFQHYLKTLPSIHNRHATKFFLVVVLRFLIIVGNKTNSS
jgi:hypothetical protein